MGAMVFRQVRKGIFKLNILASFAPSWRTLRLINHEFVEFSDFVFLWQNIRFFLATKTLKHKAAFGSKH